MRSEHSAQFVGIDYTKQRFVAPTVYIQIFLKREFMETLDAHYSPNAIRGALDLAIINRLSAYSSRSELSGFGDCCDPGLALLVDLK